MRKLCSITEDNSTALTKLANKEGIRQEDIVQIVSNGNTLSLFYYAE